ncbi:MAG: AmmeMemoRadiSam system radical SAM enzyme [Candidatus Melainabacteria bacterium GWF2_37_15]|nr:MAG: AmmeMemoRadiSam system radical SAM enzyme [Candidatus Melainabacteria bacterium GWF2_37_15]
MSRKNVDGEMVLNTYAMASSIAVDPIEKKPLYQFHPGTKVFSVGGWGCNFQCKHCQNWHISQDMQENKGYCLPPEKMIELAIEHKCEGVCWTYNEPAIWLEYTIDSAKLAKEKGLYTAYVTNGFMTIEALDLIAPYLDVFRVDLKSFDDEFYREISGIKSGKGVFETARHAKELGMHIEAVTNIIPTKNDSEENLKNLAEWIAENLGKDTPWHVTRFFPNYKLDNIEPTPIETLKKAEELGKQAGLKYIYLGNIK